MESPKPDYKRIYSDIISKKYPHKNTECQHILQKKELSVLDIIHLNTLIFGTADKEVNSFNQKHRSYGPSTILEILKYQKKNNLNNIQTANYFKLSRNTLAKWKKIF